jgi:5-methyltetrahydropteroyltriglutamate--homocysteine methyltransferase
MRVRGFNRHLAAVRHRIARVQHKIENGIFQLIDVRHIDLGLVDEFKMVSSLTDAPVKITMTGSHMLAKVAYDEHYDDITKMMADFGKLLRHNFKMLAEAGCKHIQIDEPLFTLADDAEVGAAVNVINMAIEGLPRDIHTSTHVCQGNYAVGKEYDGQIGHRYFDAGHYKADLVCKIETTSYLGYFMDSGTRQQNLAYAN